MRVIAGAAKGHKLQTIEGLNTRPTTDRIKETLFNIIAFDLPESRFLDLFSGSVLTGLAQLSAEKGTFDIIFMDPPYAAGLAEPTLEKIVSGGLLAPEGMVIVERSAQIPLAPIKGLYVDREKNYKTTVITFLRPEESAT